MTFQGITGGLVVLLLAMQTIQADAAPKTDEAAGLALFESKIRPLLVKHCYKCHSAKAGDPEGGLLLDSRVGLREGGNRGPALVPFKPEESLLLSAMSHSDPDLKMPPKKDRLPVSALHEVENWIRLGAPDPREAEPAGETDWEARRRLWAFQKPVLPEIPQPKNSRWGTSPIDQFILAKLESAGLSSTTDANPATLLRRLHFDLVGLPPSPAAIANFHQSIKTDGLDQALAAEVDALLASTHFGERWGRHWLDVARFAESSGKEANVSFPYAFRYRNYVIDSVNADVPFDRFLTEQIAGDLLPAENETERARLLIATGFLAIGPKNLDEGNAFQFEADVIDEQIDAVTRAVLANSVACARCHDHKFDPYTMEDYYALAGVFASTKTYFGTHVSPANRVSGDPLPLPLGAGLPVFHPGIPAAKVQQLKTDLAALQEEQRVGMEAIKKALEAGEDPGEIFTLTDALRIFWSSGGIEGQLEKVDSSGKPLPLAMGVMDREEMINAPLLARGDVTRPGDAVPRRFPELLQLDSAPIPTDQSGRLQFAQWLTHPDQPLTARVMANRIWHHLLGAGLVRTVDNFGTTGELPSHPELLDYLAVRFVADGWSVKQLVREIVLSRAYRQASTYAEPSFQIDPDNRLLWRASKRRLDAECIRDAMLAASGDLEEAHPQGSLVARVIGDRPISLIGLDSRIPKDLDGTLHRSVYLPVLRDRLPDVLDLFDFAEPSLVTGARETTNVPVQALYLMNSPFVWARAEAFAGRLEREAKGEEERIRLAYRLCFGRAPDAKELQLGLTYLKRAGELQAENVPAPKPALASYCQALLSTAEFRCLD